MVHQSLATNILPLQKPPEQQPPQKAQRETAITFKSLQSGPNPLCIAVPFPSKGLFHSQYCISPVTHPLTPTHVTLQLIYACGEENSGLGKCRMGCNQIPVVNLNSSIHYMSNDTVHCSWQTIQYCGLGCE